MIRYLNTITYLKVSMTMIRYCFAFNLLRNLYTSRGEESESWVGRPCLDEVEHNS